MSFAQQASDLFGVRLSPEQVQQFEALSALLIDWNERINLTAITDPEGIRVRHFLDSLSTAPFVKPNQRIVDVGSGAGFPGLPVAIAFPEVHVTLMDSTGKKVAFIQHTIETLGLKNAQAIQTRAEDAGQSSQHRQQYDLVLARAVARLPALLEYLLPLTKINGHCIAMKGDTAEEEANSARQALQILGGILHKIDSVDLPGIDTQHFLIVVRKVAPTPPSYPRRTGIPTRDPIT